MGVTVANEPAKPAHDDHADPAVTAADDKAFNWAAAAAGHDKSPAGQAALAAAKHAAAPHAAHASTGAGAHAETGQAGAAHGANDPAKLAANVQSEYGVRPHNYNGMVGGNSMNASERLFVATLPKVVAHLNEIAAKKGVPYRFTEAELATNFITEGGYYLLFGVDTPMTNIDGFSSLGIDTFVSRRHELKPWMSKDLETWSGDASHGEERQNEKNETVHSITVRDVPQGVEANGVMFAGAREHFYKDCVALGIDATKLPAEAWFFWTTIYYNSGEGTGHKMLKAHGVDLWKQKWKLPDDNNTYNTSPNYNAHWRTATWDNMRRSEGDHLDKDKPEKTTQP